MDGITPNLIGGNLLKVSRRKLKIFYLRSFRQYQYLFTVKNKQKDKNIFSHSLHLFKTTFHISD